MYGSSGWQPCPPTSQPGQPARPVKRRAKASDTPLSGYVMPHENAFFLLENASTGHHLLECLESLEC